MVLAVEKPETGGGNKKDAPKFKLQKLPAATRGCLAGKEAVWGPWTGGD